MGQADPRIDFLSRGNGLTSYLNNRGAVFSVKGAPVRMHLVGASNSKPQGADPLPGTSSYFRGNDQTKWRVGVPQFGRVQYQNVYPGIDVVYYGSHGDLEYDFQLAPGADPGKIRIAYDGSRRLKIDANGDLILTTVTGEIRQKRPAVYQEKDGARTQIAAAYRLAGRGTVALTISKYDCSRPLIIDPVLQYSTFFGGAGLTGAEKVKLDAAGNLYIAAVLPFQPDSNPFSTTPAATPGQEVAVVKFSPAKNTVLSVVHVGSDGMNYFRGFALDAAGAMYLAGTTTSADFPLVNPMLSKNYGAFGQAFLTKIAADGKTLVYSTYFGGHGTDTIVGLAVDANGNAYIAGNVESADFPLLNALYSSGQNAFAFLSEISPTGSLLFSTLYPGMGGANCVVVDGNGGVYMVGSAVANWFPLKGSIQPQGGFLVGKVGVVKFTADGQSVIYSTMFGGTVADEPWAAAADAQGNVYVTGITESPDFPMVNAVQNHAGFAEDIFVAEVNPQGNALVFSTYLSGSGDDYVSDLTLDSLGRIYVVGYTASSDFPVLNSTMAPPPKTPGQKYPDYGFLTAFAPGGTAMLYSMLIGGTLEELAWGVTTDTAGNVYVVGQTSSTDFPVSTGAYQQMLNGQWDGFLMTFAPDAASAIPAIGASSQVLTFFGGVGTASPPPQTVTIKAPAGATISTSASTTSGGNWVSATLSGNYLSVSANSAGLAQGDYSGTIQIAAGTGTLNLLVILHIVPPPAVLTSYSPNPVAIAGGGLGTPPVPLTIHGSGFVWGASARVYLSAPGLPTSYKIASNQVTFVDTSTVQFYPGVGSTTPLSYAVTVTNPNSIESNALTIQVGSPSPQITAVQNAASGSQGGTFQPISPGEIVTITGIDFGSPVGVSAPVNYTAPVTKLGDTRVLFNGSAVPITYVSGTQINAVAPYSLSGQATVNVTVEFLGVASAPTTLPVVPSMAGLFTADSSGKGQASIVNQDGSTNSSSNPAALGSTITLYATGVGMTNPQLQDGAAPQDASIQPALPVSVAIDGQAATVLSAYVAPGMWGVLVINAQVPATTHAGPAIPIVVQAGTTQSQPGTTIATH